MSDYIARPLAVEPAPTLVPGATICRHIGVARVGKVWVRKRGDSTWEARQAVAIFGSMNDEANADRCPFDEDFDDNYAKGIGVNIAAALTAMEKDCQHMAVGLI